MSRTFEGIALAAVLLAASPAGAVGSPPTCGSLQTGTTFTCNPYFDYFGGQVISNVKLYAVFWDNTVSHEVVAGIPDFYKTLANSEYLDWLSEYSTTIPVNAGTHNQQQGSGQVVGRGTFAGAITLPSLSMTYAVCPFSSTRTCITDDQIRSELKWQIAQGRLPAPDAYTLYMIHLPASVIIYDPGGVGVSCATFCAYHDTVASNGSSIYYGVIPALDSRGCRRGCGMGTLLQNTSASASHEIAEAITDAQVGLAQGARSFDYPLGWYDANQPSMGEIGDLCSGLTDTLGSDGLRGCSGTDASCYTVQPIFSRALWTASLGDPTTPACVSTRYAEGGDYSLALSPNTLSVPAGASSAPVPVVTSLTATADPAGPMPLSLSFPDMPAGVHATLDKSSIDAGDTAHVTVTVAPGTAPFSGGVLVVQASGNEAHSAALLIDVTAAEQALPAISFLTPAEGAVLKGSVPVQVMATAGSSAIASITILADDATLSSGTDQSATWDTTTVKDGSHTLTAIVVDANGAAVTAAANVSVSNTKKVVVASLGTPMVHKSGCSSAGTGGGELACLLLAAALLRRR